VTLKSFSYKRKELFIYNFNIFTFFSTAFSFSEGKDHQIILTYTIICMSFLW